MGQDFCKHCGSTDIGELPNIYIWEEVYEKKYGEPYVNHKRAILRGGKKD
jgi:hypothetical protein